MSPPRRRPRGAPGAPGPGHGTGGGGGRGGYGAGTGRPPLRAQPPRDGLGGDQVEGRQAVRELLAANRRPVTRLFLADGMDPAAILDEIEALAAKRRVRIEYVSRKRLDSLARTEGPQGVVALAKPVRETPLDVLAEGVPGDRAPFLLVLDGITDPQNVGALLRSAECAGVTGVVFPRHRSAHLSPTVVKVAAGAVEYLPMAVVSGVPTALQRLDALGVMTVGLDAGAPRPLHELAVGDEPVAVVLGSEGSGLAALTRKRCRALVSIPQRGTLSSLNVATAGAIACFDIARHRSA